MMNLKTIALAAALTLSAGGVALADESALSALSSASTVSFQTVQNGGIGATAEAPNAQLVDLQSLKSRIMNDPKLLAQLDSYGASIEDVVGISATSETDVTIYVLG